MNLVAKEFVATRTDDDGVLVLSEFAGAADELREAVLVNPFDIPGTAAALHDALNMPPPERTRRMSAMRGTVLSRSIHRWGEIFLRSLEFRTPTAGSVARVVPPNAVRVPC
jgi:trehalose-6-phosphate synthase